MTARASGPAPVLPPRGTKLAGMRRRRKAQAFSRAASLGFLSAARRPRRPRKCQLRKQAQAPAACINADQTQIETELSSRGRTLESRECEIARASEDLQRELASNERGTARANSRGAKCARCAGSSRSTRQPTRTSTLSVSWRVRASKISSIASTTINSRPDQDANSSSADSPVFGTQIAAQTTKLSNAESEQQRIVAARRRE